MLHVVTIKFLLLFLSQSNASNAVAGALLLSLSQSNASDVVADALLLSLGQSKASNAVTGRPTAVSRPIKSE